jgi:hypothetical protein
MKHKWDQGCKLLVYGVDGKNGNKKLVVVMAVVVATAPAMAVTAEWVEVVSTAEAAGEVATVVGRQQELLFQQLFSMEHTSQSNTAGIMAVS